MLTTVLAVAALFCLALIVEACAEAARLDRACRAARRELAADRAPVRPR
jgi:hypothetical protein